MAAEPRGTNKRCTNCGAGATGIYCARCGQRVEPPVHTVWGFIREATESLTHADSRLWRTLLALLVRPGQLTREFLDGRRASYLPPFRLYLILSLLFFVVAALVGGTDLSLDQRADLKEEAASLKASTDPEERAAGERLAQLADGKPCDIAMSGNAFLDWLEPRLRRSCEQTIADGGRALGREFMANVPRMLFLFLPLIAFVMMLMFWFPRRYYVEHLLFFVHSHSFTFLLYMLLILASATLSEDIGDLLELAAFAYAAWYLFRAMRVVYGQGRALTFVKYVTIGVVYFTLLTVLSMLTLFYSMERVSAPAA